MTSPYREGTARFVSAVEGGMLRRKGITIGIKKRDFLRRDIKQIMTSNSLEIKGDEKEFINEITNNNAPFQPYP